MMIGHKGRALHVECSVDSKHPFSFHADLDLIFLNHLQPSDKYQISPYEIQLHTQFVEYDGPDHTLTILSNDYNMIIIEKQGGKMDLEICLEWM